MQCPRCGFENMPGMNACLRCRSVLVAGAAVVVRPPRAGWGRPLRSPLYALRRATNSIVGRWIGPAFGWIGRLVPVRFHDVTAAALSLVPGLGYVFKRRWRTLAWIVPLWAVRLGAGVNLYGMKYGLWLIGGAIALHGWMICDAGHLRRYVASFGGRFVLVGLCFALVLFAVYMPIRVRIERRVHGVHSILVLPAAGVARGDYLLFVPGSYATAPPRRGDVALVQVAGGTFQIPARDGPWPVTVRVRGGLTMGRVLAEPGDLMEIERGVMKIVTPDGRAIEREAPPLFHRMEARVTVPDGRYLVYGDWVRAGMAIDDSKFLLTVCLMGREQFRERAVMVYTPPSHRRMLERMKEEG